MRRGGLIAWVAIVTIAVFAVPAASAATLHGDYQLQGTRASSGPGPTLTDLGPGVNVFTTESVFGGSRQVLAFPQGNGLRLNPTSFTSNAVYSIVSTFRLNDVSGYRKILDLTNDTYETGVYAHDGKLDVLLTPGNEHETGVVLSNNAYLTLAVVADSGNNVHTYVNGSKVMSSSSVPLVNGSTIRFFKDEAGGSDESSAGAVSCIRVYDGTLTDGEVGAIGASPDCVAHPPSGGATKKPARKCKKRKKYRRSAAAAKCKRPKKKSRAEAGV